MPDRVSFEIITPEGLKFQAEVYEVVLPTPLGYIGILPNHIPLISTVSPGVMRIRHHKDDPAERVEVLATAGGFVDVDGKRVRLLADTAERAEDIDEERAQTALVQAQEIKKQAKDQEVLTRALQVIEHHTARLKVAELKRRRHSQS